MTLAFRLYGDFHWPPSSGAAPAEPPKQENIRQGRIEIHFVKQPGFTMHRPLLRWLPGARIDNPPLPDPLPDMPALFSQSAQELADWFTANKDTDGMLWLGTRRPGESVSPHSFAIFRGGFLFEQYTVEGSNDLELQWPIVAQTAYRPDSPVYSVLGLCYQVKPLLYFNFHLPLPVRRSSLEGATRDNSSFFPFSAVYDLTPTTMEKLSQIDKLFGGWQKDDLLPEPNHHQDPCFAFRGENIPQTPRLGSFDFAEYAENSGIHLFAQFDLPRETSRHYWPLNKCAVLQDILWSYGFELKYNDTDWLDAADIGIADSSLRFSKIVAGGGRGNRSALIYRATVKRNGNAPEESELQTSRWWGDLRLRLKDELGGRRADQTQFGAGETIDDEQKREIEGWLRIGQTLSVDCELAWEISSKDIWSGNRAADWSPTVTVRLHWLEDVSPNDVMAARAMPQPAGASGRYDFKAGLLAQANFTFHVVRAALKAGEAGQPHSFLPKLSAGVAEKVRFTLYGSPLPAKFDGNRVIIWGRSAPTKDNPSPPWRRPPMRLTLASEKHVIEGIETVKSLLLHANEVTFFQRGGKLDLKLLHDPNWPPQSSESVADGPPFFASFQLEAHPIDDWRGRLSSLQFVGVTPKSGDKKKLGHLRTGGRGTWLGLGSGALVLAYPNGRIATELNLPLPVAKVEPIGVDVARSDRTGRPAPLLIPVDRPVAGGKATENPFWLTATETLSPTQDRWLEASILEQSQETGSRSYVVLSSEPFTIYRFTQQALADRGDASNSSVAVYSGDDRIWQYKRVSDYYHYVLPPQSVGESADKPRRLEIHDLPDPDPNNESPPRPFVKILKEDDKGNSNLDPLSDVRRRAVEFRLTPSAELWIRPSDVQRGYFMPESASYEIFRQFGELGLGAALAYLRAEFLYGLPVGIDVSRERSIARGARVAEIEALTGRLTGPARETVAEADLVSRWNALRAAVARRPERLEIWARDLDSVIDFTPARFSDGVKFALRHSALHRAALIDKTSPDEEASAYKSWPRVGGVDPEKVSPGLELHPRHHPQGMSGGALWPVESLNLFRTMLRTPQSSGGTIETIALSPLGGDATQKAEFLGGKVTIISDTRNGYVERQQVEVLGRICALWHRAKHVVVYERTVNPSAQFAPKKAEDPERTRSRRPILRKVREYIELLQPERSYPDFSTAALRSAGFLQRVRFNSRIINVDSAWSSEVGDFGWEIPLWNRLAARERPQVYPMPDVAFVSIAEGDGEKPVVAQECLDPDYLFFFADVSPDTTSDTNSWPSRLNLDFPNMPIATAIAEKADAKSKQDPDDEGTADGRRRAVGRILPGLRRFTWRLAPAAQKAAINAGRAGKPVYAGLESVSFMRATHATKKDKDDLGVLKGLFDSPISKLRADQEKPETVSLQYWDSSGNGGISPLAKEFALRLQGVIKAAQDKGDVPAARKALYDLWIKPPFVADVKQLATKINPKHFENIPSVIKEGPGHCAKLKTDAVGLIQRKEMLVRAALQDWVAQADEIVTQIRPYLDTVTKTLIIDRLQDRALRYITPIFEEASDDVTKVEEGVEKSRAVLLDLETEIEQVIERARQRIRQFVNGYDQTKPWSTERRISLRNGLQACLSNVRDDIAAGMEEARQRLGVELNDVSQAIGGFIAKQLRELGALEADSLNGITTVRRAANDLFAKIDRTLEQLLNGAAGVGKLDGLNTKIQAAKVSAPLKKKAETVMKAAKTACLDAQTKLAEARAKAKAIDKRAEEALSQVADVIKAFVDSLQAIATAIMSLVTGLIDLAKDLAAENAKVLADEVTSIADDVKRKVDEILAWPDQWLQRIGDQIDAMVVPATQYLDSLLVRLKAGLRTIPGKALPVIKDVKQALHKVQERLAPNGLLQSVIKECVIRAALVRLLGPLPEAIDPAKRAEIEAATDRIRAQLGDLVETVGGLMRNLTESAFGALDEVTNACKEVFEGAAQAEAYLKTLATNAQAYVNKRLDDAFAALKAKLDPIAGEVKDVVALVDAVGKFDRSVRGLQNDMSRAYETARVYTDRVFDQFSKIGDGGVLAAPSNILKLYSAVTTAPEIAALKVDIDRIRAGYDELSDIIDTTKANALFNRLGDELKALGLSLPFDKIGDRLLPADLSNVDIAKLFRSFGGAKFASMLSGYKVPAGVKDAIRVSHDFDAKQGRAWVQVDINAPMPGRRSLFSVGVFKADFVDMQLTGQVRLEASKDQDKVTETGYGRIGTAIDMVAGGQSMVRFEKFGLNYTREKGLDVEFDPKNIRLNPSFKFIQDFLSTLFPDDVGGLQIVKQNGIPVGVQHDFAIPPMALNFGTSGVSNISIANHFKLLAYPDFMLANRFNLSSVERPFIFSIFIIGGTGYIQIDAEYRPFDSELMVSVEAGAGGSASLAFAFGPFSGQVFITLSGALTYRKVIGKPGGGLSISVVLVIAGHVDVCGIITVGIVLMLRMTYRDNGQIDGDGSLAVEIRISRFFKITARANVRYKLRGGKSETQVSASASGKLTGEAKEKVDAVKAAAKKLESARN